MEVDGSWGVSGGRSQSQSAVICHQMITGDHEELFAFENSAIVLY